MSVDERKAPSSDLLRTFVAIASCENLTLAAERLGRTQSAVSVQLKRLEHDLGAQLFERRARGMALTQAGERLLPVAERALGELERAAALFSRPLAGRLRVGIPDDFDDTILEATLAAFAARHPGVEIEATSGCTATYPERIRRNELDVAVASSVAALDGELLTIEPTVWACAVDAVVAKDGPAPLAVLDRACWWRSLPTDALKRCGRPWRIAYQTSSFSSLCAAIRAGLAVGVLPARSLDAKMRGLSERDGFPTPPPAHRTILISTGAPRDPANAMASAFQSAARSTRPVAPGPADRR